MSSDKYMIKYGHVYSREEGVVAKVVEPVVMPAHVPRITFSRTSMRLLKLSTLK